MAYLTGYTGAELIESVADTLQLDTVNNATHLAQAIKWINYSQLDMYRMGIWSELRVQDASFDTDGSTSYDLTSEIVSNFGRLIDGTVRTGSYNLLPVGKALIDEIDPSRTWGDSKLRYCIINRKDFRIFPYGSDGDTIYMDYVTLPVAIDENTAAASISFDPSNHELIADGAIWRGLKAKMNPSNAGSDWYTMKREWIKDVKRALADSRPVSFNIKEIQPTDLGF